jgi:hypothetical protein
LWMSAGPVLFVNLAGNLKRFRPGQQREPHERPSDLFWFSGRMEEEKW